MNRSGEYLSSNRYIRYPFEDNSTVTSASGKLEDRLAIVVFGCFVDAYVQLKSQTDTVIPAVSGIGLNAHTLSFSLSVPTDVSYAKVNVTCTRTLSRFLVIKGESDWCWYSFVISTDGIREYEECVTGIGDITGATLYLSQRCLGQSANGITSIGVYGGEEINPATGVRYTCYEALELDPEHTLSGSIALMPGYNMRFDNETEGISINAAPGEGQGVAPCECEDTEVAFKTPGLLSSNGHTRIFNDTCYDLEPMFINDSFGYLALHAKCTACCTCDMYADIVNNRLVPISNKIKYLKGLIDGSFNTYEKYVKLWNDRLKYVHMEDVDITHTGVALETGDTDLTGDSVSGTLNRCGVSIVVKNNAFSDVKIEMIYFRTNCNVFEGQLSYMKDSSTPSITPLTLENTVKETTICSFTLPPGRSAMITFFMRATTMVKKGYRYGFMGEWRFRAYQDTRLIHTYYRTFTEWL